MAATRASFSAAKAVSAASQSSANTYSSASRASSRAGGRVTSGGCGRARGRRSGRSRTAAARALAATVPPDGRPGGHDQVHALHRMQRRASSYSASAMRPASAGTSFACGTMAACQCGRMCRSAASAAPRVPIRNSVARAADGVECRQHAVAEGAGEPLLGGEQHDGAARRAPGPAAGPPARPAPAPGRSPRRSPRHRRARRAAARAPAGRGWRRCRASPSPPRRADAGCRCGASSRRIARSCAAAPRWARSAAMQQLARSLVQAPFAVDRPHRGGGVLVEPARQRGAERRDRARSQAPSSSPSCSASASATSSASRSGAILRLRQQRAQALAARELRLHARVRRAAEAGEHLQLQELRVVEPQRAGQFAQRRRLRLAADAADAEVPMSIAGFWPSWNSRAFSTSWPSVIEIRLVGI